MAFPLQLPVFVHKILDLLGEELILRVERLQQQGELVEGALALLLFDGIVWMSPVLSIAHQGPQVLRLHA